MISTLHIYIVTMTMMLMINSFRFVINLLNIIDFMRCFHAKIFTSDVQWLMHSIMMAVMFIMMIVMLVMVFYMVILFIIMLITLVIFI